MFKLKFLGERAATFQSVPAGVLITVKPGELVELDGGFAYLREHASFRLVEDPNPAKDQGGDPNQGQGDPNAGQGDGKDAKDQKDAKDDKTKK